MGSRQEGRRSSSTSSKGKGPSGSQRAVAPGRHRLNRGGDRHANNALWRIALVRMRCHPPTRAYVERRTTQGLSKLDIMRC
jgi:transposase